MRLFILLPLFVSACWSGIFAQSVSGKVLDPAGAPAPLATLRLYALPDSQLVQSLAADVEGRYQALPPAEGLYYIRAALVGFSDQYGAAFSYQGVAITLPDLYLKENAALQAVEIRAKKPLIETFVDKTVVNVEGSVLAAGNSAFEVLQRSPGVAITPQEQIILAGKGTALILIDGRPLQLSGNELSAFLRSLPAENIRSIELITQPSAKYDAQGLAGIIDIRLRKNLSLGLNGNASASYAQSIHHRLNGGLNLNYRPGKVNVFLQSSAVDGAQSIEQSILRNQNGKQFDQSSPKIEAWQSGLLKTGADWFLNERHTLGVMAIGSVYQQSTRHFNQLHITDLPSKQLDSTLQSFGFNPGRDQRWNYNLNHQYSDTLGLEWKTDADWIYFQNASRLEMNNQYFSPDNERQSALGQSSDLSGNIKVWSLKTDLSKSLPSGWKWETGAKTTLTQSLQQTLGATTYQGVSTPDTGRTNTFDMRERIAAAYVNLHKKAGKWTLQAGLRGEHTRLKGRSTDLYQAVLTTPDTAYFGLFPSAYAQYQAAEQHQIGLSYNRRLERPAYSDLNPFTWQLDPYLSERGNPGLQPAYTHSLELKYTYRWAASIALGYARTTDMIQTLALIQANNLQLQPGNIARRNQFSLNLSTPLPIADWWEGYLWIGVWRRQFEAELPLAPLQTNAWGGGCWTGQQIKLGKGWEAEFSVWAQFPTQEGMFRNKGIASVNLGLGKSFADKKGTVKLVVNDVLGTQRWIQTVDLGGLAGRQRNDWESQSVALRLSWSFGNKDLKVRDRSIGGEEADNRIRSKRAGG